MLLGLLNLLATVASYFCKPLLQEIKLLCSGKDEVAHLHPQPSAEGKHQVLWAERRAAGYQVTPQSTACSLWRRCCSQQSKAKALGAAALLTTSYPVGARLREATTPTPVMGSRGSSGRASLRSRTSGIMDWSWEKGAELQSCWAPHPTRSQRTESTHACQSACADTPQTAKVNTGLGQTHLLHFHLLLIRGYTCAMPNRLEIWAGSL